MSLPFTPQQFFEVFAAYNLALWPFALALWISSLAGAVALGGARGGGGAVAALLAIHWWWAGIAYHAVFFSAINPAAWLFAALFLIEGGLLAWFGIRGRLTFSAFGSPRHILAWTLISYALLYPLIVQREGHPYPAAPTFGLPCPTTLLTAGFLFAADGAWPRAIAVIPIVWAFIGASAAMLLDVRADLMLGVAGTALLGYIVAGPARREVHA